MKKCCACDFMTPNKEYIVCPMCGEKLDIYKGKQKFTMGVYGEDGFSAEIEMTYEEALIVKRVIDELMCCTPCDECGYYGTVWIDIEE